MYFYFVLAGTNNIHISALPLCYVYELFIMDIILGYCFDSQCLSECCLSSTNVDKKSTTGERKQLEKESSRNFSRTIYFGRSIKCIDIQSMLQEKRNRWCPNECFSSYVNGLLKILF